MLDIVIVGSSGFACEIEWLIERINRVNPTWNFLGFIDKIDKQGCQYSNSVKNVIGDDNFVVTYNKDLYVAIAIGNPKIRKEISSTYLTNPRIKFPNLIDPSVILSDKIKLGYGNIICAGTILTVNITCGNCNIINLDCTVGHDVIIGDFVTINPSVNISGNVNIESEVNIGTGSQIIQGLQVGHNSILGAGSVVNKNLPANCTAVGVPAKVIKVREETAK